MKLEFEYKKNNLDQFGLDLKNELNSFDRLGDGSVNLIFDAVMNTLVKESQHQNNELIKINFKGYGEDKYCVDFNFANNPNEVFVSIKNNLINELNQKFDEKIIDKVFNVLTAYCESFIQKTIDNSSIEKDTILDNIKNLKLRAEYKRQLIENNQLNPN